MAIKVVIMGAAGRDFHNFNVYFKMNPHYQVVAFTGAQIPDIAGRVYPPELAGPNYPDGIPIVAEEELPGIIRKYDVERVVFAYSDVSHDYVMQKASRVLSSGADFMLMGPKTTMLSSRRPVVSICAVRTGAGKSQTTRKVVRILKEAGFSVAVVRHPMPYGDLGKQACQRFSRFEDLDLHRCTVEEREEYEPHIGAGNVVYAGVDYYRILRAAEAEAQVIVWDGGNNDLPFFRPDLHIVVADPHRPGHEVGYHPGETNLLMADVVVINKVDTADGKAVALVRRNIEKMNPGATIIEAASPIFVDEPMLLRGKRALVVEDGPTLTHGEMAYGAGVVAAKRYGASHIIDPRPYAAPDIAEVYRKYQHLGAVLPAMGYGPRQIRDLEATINSADCDVVVVATPVDLRRLVRTNKETVRVRYELQEIGYPSLADVLAPVVEKIKDGVR